MAVTTKKYTKKTDNSGRIYRAIRVTARNFINVANWCNGDAISHISGSGDISKQRVKVKGLVAQIGDFVVKDDDGKFFRVKDDVFEAEYKLKV